MTAIHTIPVPEGWSIEQAWEAICRKDKLPAPAGWAVICVRDGKLIKGVR
jgi:hypothetical protein